MTHNKYLKFRFLDYNDSILAKSAAQIFKPDIDFFPLNVLITGLCNSSASCSFTLISNPDFL